MLRFIRNLINKYDDYTEEKPVFRGVFLPSILTSVGLLCLIFRPTAFLSFEISTLIFWVLTLAYFIIILFKSYVDYKDALSEKRNENRLHSLVIQIKHLDQCVVEKRNALVEAIKFGRNPSKILERSRDVLYYRRSVSVINRELLLALEQFLKETGNSKDSHIVCCLLEAKTTNDLFVRAQYRNSGTSLVPGDVRAKTDDIRFLASRLWADNGSRLYESHSSTLKASNSGLFLFRTEAEKETIKSIFCYKLIDPITGQPFGIWSIHSDREDVFPDVDDIRVKEIVNIVYSFSERILIERVYREIFKQTDEIFKRAIKLDQSLRSS